MSAPSAWHASSVAASRVHCAALVKREARNFHHGLKLSPEPQRSGLYAVYAWMRRADDLVDGGGADRIGQVQAFRDATARAFAGTIPGTDPMWPALVESIHAWGLDRRDFDGMLDGQLLDADHVPCPDWPSLRHFCDLVAGTVGRTCTRIFGPLDARAIDLATERGIAFQLTNILRDVREDHAMGRCYLPADELNAAGLSIDGLLAWQDDARCEAFIAAQVKRCLAHYASSAALDGMIEPACRPTLWAMTRIYGGIARRIAADPRCMTRGRVGLGAGQKLMIAARAKLGWYRTECLHP